ncbi:MAG TPA: 6-phosphofructokinase [Flavobacteriales bacterium]|jgi:6-phosphofructokinase 1|nr:6-phosphofructokinase [Flavobacteriales bacterium]
MSTPIERIGVFTSGGDGPGMNAAIRAVVRTAALNGVEVVGILGGYDGLVNDRVRALGPRDVSNIVQRGGTILRTARSEAFRTREGRATAHATLQRHGIDGLVAIGGDGTFTGAHILFEEFGTRVIGLPGTIDNDLYGTDRTIGFDTALNTAVEAIDRIRDTASSHDRLFFVEVMGRNTGHIALQCAVAAGAEYVLVPEVAQSIEALVVALSEASGMKSSSIVVVAEGDEEGGAFQIARKVKERSPGYDIRVSVLGHIQRGGTPSVNDRILASRTGVAAVEHLLQGDHDAMVGLVNENVVLTPFADAIGNQKALPQELFHVLTVLAT